MPSKDFEQTVRFYEYQPPNGSSIWLPLVSVIVNTPNSNNRVTLPLLFDTGASVTTLRAEFYPVLGLSSWNQGQSNRTATAGGVVDVYQYTADIELFGETIAQCPINLIDGMPPNPLYSGLLGRDTAFEKFGFGFWESTHEIYITKNP